LARLQVAEAKSKSTKSEQRDARAGGEVGEEVDVGVRCGFAPGSRTEEAQMCEARRLEFRRVAAENRENAVCVHFE
jgi:hypothetical protein